MDDNKPSPHGTGWTVPKPLTWAPQESTDLALQLGRFTWCQMAQLFWGKDHLVCWRGMWGAGGDHGALHSVRGAARGGPLATISLTPFQSCIPPSFCPHVGPSGPSAWLILIFQYIITNNCQNNQLDHWTVSLIWSPRSHLVIVLILMTKQNLPWRNVGSFSNQLIS